jgi:hypothetical protein
MPIFIKFLSRPQTPLQRLGAIGLMVAITLFLWTAVDWQIGEGFVRQSPRLVALTEPEDIVEGHRWERDRALPFTWRLLEEACLSQIQRKSSLGGPSPDEQRTRDCTRKEQPGFERATSYELNLRGYFEALTGAGPYRRAYRSTVTAAAATFALALMTYFGLLDRLLCWIRTGQLQQPRPPVAQ